MKEMKTREKNEHQTSLLVIFWSRFFCFLGKLSVFKFVTWILGKLNIPISFKFVDLWVLTHFFVAIILSYLIKFIDIKCVLLIVLLYGLLRVFEILIYQINVVLFDPFINGRSKNDYRIKSVQRMILALIMNYIEIVFWFVVISIATIKIYDGVVIQEWTTSLKDNMLTVMTLSPVNNLAAGYKSYTVLSHLVVFEIVAGLIMTLISMTRFIGLLPKLSQIDK